MRLYFVYSLDRGYHWNYTITKENVMKTKKQLLQTFVNGYKVIEQAEPFRARSLFCL